MTHHEPTTRGLMRLRSSAEVSWNGGCWNGGYWNELCWDGAYPTARLRLRSPGDLPRTSGVWMSEVWMREGSIASTVACAHRCWLELHAPQRGRASTSPRLISSPKLSPVP